jgi:hypothetical protein
MQERCAARLGSNVLNQMRKLLVVLAWRLVSEEVFRSS